MAMGQQTEPVLNGNGHQVSRVKSFSEEIVQHHPDSAYMAEMFSVGHTDKSRNKVWRRSVNQRVPGELDSFPAPVNSTTEVISNVYRNQMFGPQSALYLDNHAAATGLVSNNVAHGSLPMGNNILSVSENQYLKHPEQIQLPFGSSAGNDSSNDHRTASPVNPPKGLSRDFSYFSRQTSHSTPLAYEQNRLKPKYRKYPPRGYQRSSGKFDRGESLHSVTQPDVLYPQKPPSLKSYIPRREIYIPNHTPKYRGKMYQTSVGKKSKDVYYTPSIHQPEPSGSASGFNNFLSQSRGSMASQKTAPQKQDNSHLVPGVKVHYSHLSNSGYQKDVGPSYLKGQAEDKPDRKNQDLVPAFQNPKENFVKVHTGTQKISSPRRRNKPNSLSAQDNFLYLNGGYHEAMKAGLVKNFNQPIGLQMFPASVNKEPINLDSWPSEMLRDSKPLYSNCIVWQDTKSSYPQKFHKTSKSLLSRYIRSKNRSARATAYLSKTCFKPRQRANGKAAKRQRKFAARRRI